MLYNGFTNENDLGANNDQVCTKLYLDYEQDIYYPMQRELKKLVKL